MENNIEKILKDKSSYKNMMKNNIENFKDGKTDAFN